ncbi:MAG: YbaB/EbfC family nucleoid-associated protein [Chthonomonadales bacterium]|nr:YbaB/EbfC family nucleoid-associated protein [Chthonomonadales bacterium]
MAPAFGGRNPLGGLGDIGKLMKQAQKMQEDMLAAQEQLEAARVEAASGGGAVKATVNGKGKLVSIEVSPDAVDPDDVEMLQDLIVTAVREAQDRAEAEAEETMKGIAGAAGLPGGLF